jgi:hypothetical protein
LEVHLRRGVATFAIAVVLVIAAPAVVLADNITNGLDSTADASLEVLTLYAGGTSGTVTLSVQATNGDGRNGCNFGGGGGSTFTTNVSSSDPAVANVSPSSVVFSNCGSRTLSIVPAAVGSTDVTLSPGANTTLGTFNLAPAAFTINVVSAPTPTVTTLPLGGGDLGVGSGVNPAQTPELGSLVLFGTGAAGMAGYTLIRFRSRRQS